MSVIPSLGQGAGELAPPPPFRTPDVTFIIAAFNVAAYIEAAVASALAQNDIEVEVIVVDDASTDQTADIVARMAAADSRVTLVRQSKNLGPGAVRNIALKHSKAKWVAILDGDDLITANRTAELIKCAEATGADIVGDNFERITVDGKPTGKLLFATSDVPFLFEVDAASFIEANQVFARTGFSLGAIKIMVRSEFLSDHVIAHPDDLPVGEDFHFILSCLLAGARFVVTSTPGYKYRLRPGSQSWRLTDEHMRKLNIAHAGLLRDVRRAGCPRAEVAAANFGRSLERTTNFVHAVTMVSQGSWSAGLRWVAAHPPIWPLVARIGSQVAFRKSMAALGLKSSAGGI